jgi:phosphatidate cytidylyltransferase
VSPTGSPAESPAGSPTGSPTGAPGGSRWGDLSRRVASALVLLPVALVCIWAGGYAFLLFVTIGCTVLASEWVTMCGYSSPDPVYFWFPAVLAFVAVLSGLDIPWAGLAIVLLGSAAAALWGGQPRSPRDGTLAHPKLELAFGVPYIGLAAAALPWLRADPVAGLANTLFVLVVIWASDIGAYVIGRIVGGPKLARSISPGKTWSGAAGGLASAAIGGLVVAACLPSGISPSHATGPAIFLGIISQAGDLLESALKRHFGVKDSGRIIPGHGGLLDRLDALLAVAPVAALLALTVGRGVVLWR